MTLFIRIHPQILILNSMFPKGSCSCWSSVCRLHWSGCVGKFGKFWRSMHHRGWVGASWTWGVKEMGWCMNIWYLPNWSTFFPPLGLNLASRLKQDLQQFIVIYCEVQSCFLFQFWNVTFVCGFLLHFNQSDRMFPQCTFKRYTIKVWLVKMIFNALLKCP